MGCMCRAPKRAAKRHCVSGVIGWLRNNSTWCSTSSSPSRSMTDCGRSCEGSTPCTMAPSARDSRVTSIAMGPLNQSGHAAQPRGQVPLQTTQNDLEQEGYQCDDQNSPHDQVG